MNEDNEDKVDKTVDEIIDEFLKGAGDINVEYVKMVNSVDTEGMRDDEVKELGARFRKAKRQRISKELGY